MDLISREEVRRVLAFYIYELATDALTVDEVRTKIRECIDDIPSQNKWIPCSERLPEDSEEVLITCLNEVGVGWLNYNEWKSNDFTKEMLKKVTAWQPLPKPYKAERDISYKCEYEPSNEFFNFDSPIIKDFMKKAEE